MDNLRFHHVGYATKNLRSSVSDFRKLGYKNSGDFIDNVQNINISIMERAGHPIIELIEPNNENNPVKRFLVDYQTMPYHVAYLTKTFDVHINELRSNGFTPTTNIMKAVAFENRNFIFLYSANTGFIELLED